MMNKYKGEPDKRTDQKFQ